MTDLIFGIAIFYEGLSHFWHFGIASISLQFNALIYCICFPIAMQ